jgi:hypothetical protein
MLPPTSYSNALKSLERISANLLAVLIITIWSLTRMPCHPASASLIGHKPESGLFAFTNRLRRNYHLFHERVSGGAKGMNITQKAEVAE